MVAALALNPHKSHFVLLDRAGEPWMPENMRYCARMEMVLVACYITCHCYLGPFEVPRKDELEDCPLCGELYLEDHFIYVYVALWDVRAK